MKKQFKVLFIQQGGIKKMLIFSIDLYFSMNETETIIHVVNHLIKIRPVEKIISINPVVDPVKIEWKEFLEK